MVNFSELTNTCDYSLVLAFSLLVLSIGLIGSLSKLV